MGILGAIVAMLGSSCSKRDIHVEFIDHKDNSIIGVVDLPPEKLPDTFAVDTTLDIAEKKWSVAKADPESKIEFAKTRKLRVYLVPMSAMPAGEILFSLPTISDDIGEAEGSSAPDDAVFAIHEDDWRQVEFVSQANDNQVLLEFDDIRRVYDGRKQSGGFATCHIRKRIPSPLMGADISLADLEERLNPSRKYRAVGIQRSIGTFKASFAW